MRDVTKEARAKLRARRETCKHMYEERGKKNRYWKCRSCGDRFPCTSVSCSHFDCAWEQIRQGLRIDWPSGSITIFDDEEMTKILLDTRDILYEDPELFDSDDNPFGGEV